MSCLSTNRPAWWRDHVSGRTRRRPAPGLSIALATRNDGYGGGLARRATLALQAQLEVADEVVLVDFNSRLAPMLASLPPRVRSHERLKHIVVDGAACRELRNGNDCTDRFFQTLARNIAVCAATRAVVVSSNIDVVPPSRTALNVLMGAMPEWPGPQVVYAFRRNELKLKPPTEQGATHDAAPERVKLAHTAVNRKAVLRWAESKDISFWHKFAKRMQRQLFLDASNVSLNLGRLPFIALQRISLTVNCGDFQMARRELWDVVGFAERMEGRQYDDSMLHASFFNRGATIRVPGSVHVSHISHHRPSSSHRPKRTIQSILTSEAVPSRISYGRADNSTVFWNPQPWFYVAETARGPQIANKGVIAVP